MMDTARASWQVGVLVTVGVLIACEARRDPSSEAVLPSPAERSAAGASATTPASGGAPSDPLGSGGDGPRRPSTNGVGGSDQGAGGSSGGSAGSASDGAGGRDGESQTSDEVRYAVWLGHSRNDVASPGALPGTSP